MKHKIEVMESSDWEQVQDIYLEGINSNIATFQTEAPTWENWDKGHISSCRLVVRSGNDVLGWGALSPTSSRSCYVGVVEVSIYIGEKYRGQDIGTTLLKNLIKLSEDNGIWTLYSAIIRENIPSILMHKKCGFREIGFKERVAKTGNGVWHDVVLMERRSKIVDMD